MKVKQFLILMVSVMVISWLGWLAVIFLVDPKNNGILGISLFYISFFFAITSSLALISFYLRHLFSKAQPIFEKAQISFRQAAFFAIMIIGTLFLQANQLLNWLNALLLVFFFTILEFLIISLRKT